MIGEELGEEFPCAGFFVPHPEDNGGLDAVVLLVRGFRSNFCRLPDALIKGLSLRHTTFRFRWQGAGIGLRPVTRADNMNEGLAFPDLLAQHAFDRAKVGAEIGHLNWMAADGEQCLFDDLPDTARVAAGGGDENFGGVHGFFSQITELLRGNKFRISGNSLLIILF